MTYRLANSLVELRAALNRAAPFRSRVSDGWIGDASHASRSSDHNPWVKDGKTGVVTALDLTHDPEHGVDCNVLAEALIRDPRVKYVIWDRKIWAAAKAAQGWRKYTGKNPHTKHAHTSVSSKKDEYDDAKPWTLGIEAAAEAAASLPPAKPAHQKLRLGDQGGDVFLLQTLLNQHGADLKVDGDFGPKTEKAVKAFQKKATLPVDGVVGPYTWEALEKGQDTPEVAAAELPPAPDLSGDKASYPALGTPEWAVEFLEKDRGWPKAAAIALVANLVWESAGQHRPGKPLSIVWDAVGDNGHSHTAVQWNEKHGRYQAYVQWTIDEGRDFRDPTSILMYLDKELRTSEKNAGAILKAATDPAQATADAAINFWRPGTPHTERRVAIAERLAKETGYEHPG